MVIETRELQIGLDSEGQPFGLPLDMVTGTMGILGVKGSGKTWAAGVIEEEMAERGVPFCVVDPMGAHIGIKERYPVVVFGGLRADVPLAPEVGREVAQAVVEENISAILDVSQFPKAAQRRLVADFCEELYARNSTPRHGLAPKGRS